MITIVIPTLQAAGTLPSLLGDIGKWEGEIVVSDGGSLDGTREIAAAAGAVVLSGPPGRGRQLAAGAAAASGDWLLFIHADCRLKPGWCETVERFVQDTEAGAGADRAGVFCFRLDDPSWQARVLEHVVGWRCRLFGLPYGDQGLLISKAFYRRLGGFRPIPLMEDVDLVRRIGRRRLTMLGALVETSAARYRSDGYPLRMARNALCLSLYFLGVPPRRIRRIYG